MFIYLFIDEVHRTDCYFYYFHTKRCWCSCCFGWSTGRCWSHSSNVKNCNWHRFDRCLWRKIYMVVDSHFCSMVHFHQTHFHLVVHHHQMAWTAAHQMHRRTMLVAAVAVPFHHQMEKPKTDSYFLLHRRVVVVGYCC